MFKPIRNPVLCALIGVFCTICSIQAQDITLPAPQKTGGMPLMDALNNRKSTREFSSTELPLQVLSNLLWAAYGINRPSEGKRTVPTAFGIYNMEIYVARIDGLYLYDASTHSLQMILEEDIRSQTGIQSQAGDAPVNLVYVADLSKLSSSGKAEFYSIANTGFISQNVYLFCASMELVTFVRDFINRETLHATMQLGDDQEIILAQSIGYPKGTSKVDDKEVDSQNPEEYTLSQNHPNPFNLETQIEYTLLENAHVKINIFNMNGEHIKTVVNQNQTPDNYVFKWNGLNENGHPMASGVYFYQIELIQDNQRKEQTRKMLMLK